MSKLTQQLEEDKGITAPLLTGNQLLQKTLKDQLLQKIQEEKDRIEDKRKTADFEKRALAANIENSDDFAKTRIEYFSGDNLIPQKMQVSGRFIAILFEGNEGKQEYHVIHRFTHDLVLRYQSKVSVKNFYLYDPFDCARYHTNKNSNAYVITVLQKPDENGEQQLVLQKIHYHDQTRTGIYQESERGQWATFAAVSADLKYAALELCKELNSADFGGVGGYTLNKIQFIRIGTGAKLSKIGLTEGTVAFNPAWLDGSIVFVQNQPRALVGHLLNDVSLVDVESGAVLSKVPLSAKNLALTYFQDVEKYAFITIDESKTYTIQIEDDRITAQDEEPLAYFDARNSAGLCTRENPYNYSMKSLNGSYNKSQNTGFIIDQKFFNLQMSDIKFSRVQILPGAKVFYAIKNTAPYTCFVVDLVNLEVQFQASVLDDQSATICSYYNGTKAEVVIADKAMKKTLVSHNIKQVSKFSDFVKARLPNVDARECGYFDIQKNNIILKINTNIQVYDLFSQRQVFSAFGIRIQLSQDQNSLILNKGGYQYQVWKLNQSSGQFEIAVPFLKNVAARVDFIPGSNSKIAIFDERLKALLCFDTETSIYTYIVDHAEFNSSEYHFIDENYLYYKKKLMTGGTKVNIYNYNFGFIQKADGITGDTILVQESQSKKYIYATSDDNLKVFTKDDLDRPVQVYPINQIYEIIENEDGTILKCKAQESIKVLVVGTLEPDRKVTDFTSSTFLMKYIFEILSNKESATIDKLYAIEVYSVFMQNGFVDSFFDNQGTTMLHLLIKDHSAEIFSKLFNQANGPFAYLNMFDGSSPLTYAIRSEKMQHVKIMLDYFAENPSQLKLSSQDFLNLLESNLPEAKQIIFAQFSEPQLYRAFLPFQVTNKELLYIQPVDTQILGKSQSDFVDQQINSHPETRSKLFQYAISAFKYDFTRGSTSSLEFLQAYSQEEDELVLRSQLRHIVNKKFKECMPFLVTIASIFYLYLFLYFYAILLGDAPWSLRIALISFNSFFFLLECRQLFTEGSAYFSDFWNLIDVSVYLINYFLFIYQQEETEKADNQVVQFLYSFSAFLMLLRGMSYLRIFHSLRYLINMIIEIMKDMSAFVILLVYWIVGYTFIFYIFSAQAGPVLNDDGTEGDSPFVGTLKEIYRLSYGDFAPDNYTPAQWLAFVIATFFLPLVMLNMVIALMGDTFGRVKEASACVDMKEKASMVLEVESFVNWRLPAQTEEEQQANKKHILIGYDSGLIDEDLVVAQPSKTELTVENVFSSILSLQQSVSDIAKMKSDIISEIQTLKSKQ